MVFINQLITGGHHPVSSSYLPLSGLEQAGRTLWSLWQALDAGKVDAQDAPGPLEAQNGYCGRTNSCNRWELLVTMKHWDIFLCFWNRINHLPTGAGFLLSTGGIRCWYVLIYVGIYWFTICSGNSRGLWTRLLWQVRWKVQTWLSKDFLMSSICRRYLPSKITRCLFKQS